MDDFDAYTTHKHPGNPVAFDSEKRDLYLQIEQLKAGNIKLLGALSHIRAVLRGESGYDDHELAGVINGAIDEATKWKRGGRNERHAESRRGTDNASIRCRNTNRSTSAT